MIKLKRKKKYEDARYVDTMALTGEEKFGLIPIKYEDYIWNENRCIVDIFNDDVKVENIDWYWFSFEQRLSEEFIDKYKDNIHWNVICIRQVLSIEFIEKYKNKVDYSYLFISTGKNKDLDYDGFIERNIDIFLKNYKDFPEKYRKKFICLRADLI